METIKLLYKAVVVGNSSGAAVLTKRALSEGNGAEEVIDRALMPAMATVGEKFKNSQIFVPEMLVAARAMKTAMSLLEPRLLAAGVTPKHTAIIGTVEGDLHDIGKNLVAIMWRGPGFRVIDLGVNVTPAGFITAIEEHLPDIVGLSAVLTTTMPAMAGTLKAIRASNCPPVKVIIGGAPVSQQFAEAIGADAYAADAGSAADKALELVAAGGISAFPRR